jgi:uncharacterized membrane protein YhaH (DUF805 family)
MKTYFLLFLSPIGRVDRPKFWLVIIVNALIWAIFMLSVERLFQTIPFYLGALISFVVWLFVLFSLAFITIKRMHDRDRPWFYGLLGLMLPIIGWIWWIIECGFKKGDLGVNKYGMPDSNSFENT